MIAYIDGGSRGNPGPAGFGVRIEQPDGTLVEEFSEAIGTTTNNVAEYRGLLAALEWARTHGVHELHVRSDSLLLVQQMLGRFKVKNDRLQPLHAKARQLAREIGRVSFEHVGRALNAHADRLANEAMDGGSRESPVAGRPSVADAQHVTIDDPHPTRQPPAPAADKDPLRALERDVRLFVYRHFLDTATAPDVNAIATAVGARELEVIGALHTLAELHALVLAPATTTIWMAHPFSAVPTAYPVVARGRTYFANCAFDAAGILALVGDGVSRTRCDDCGEAIVWNVRDGIVEGEGVVHFLVSPPRFWDNVAFT